MGKRERVLGGSACHFALSASSFGGDVRLVGVVGDDFPDEYTKILVERGIDLTGLERRPGKTFRWSGRYERFGTAISLSTELNVFEDFDPKIPGAFRDSDVVFLGNIAPALQSKVLDQVDERCFTVMDTMNYWIQSVRDDVLALFGRVDVAIVNDQEAKDLTGCLHAVDAGRALLETGVGRVIVKKGEHGAVLLGKDELFSCPSYPSPEILDTTGAGDSFAGGFCGSLDRDGERSKEALRRAVVYGCVLGSFNIEGFGPERMRRVGRADVEERYAAVKEMTIF